MECQEARRGNSEVQGKERPVPSSRHRIGIVLVEVFRRDQMEHRDNPIQDEPDVHDQEEGAKPREDAQIAGRDVVHEDRNIQFLTAHLSWYSIFRPSPPVKAA